VILSLNEIESVVLKAARGAGYEWGLAEEAGAAARWLAQHGLPWAATVATVLAENTVRLAGAGRAMSNPLVAGTWVSDGLTIDSGTGLNLESVVAPLWLAATVGVGGRGKPARVSIAWPQATILTLRGALLHAAGDLANSGPSAVSIRTVPIAEDTVATVRDPSHDTPCADDTVWHLLMDLGQRTYVPASVRSRTTGAGADLSDND